MIATAAAPRTILSVFATFAVGGPQVRFAALANRYGDRYRHLVVAMDGNHACRERLAAGLDVTFPTLTFRKGATLANRGAFRRKLREWRPDVLVTNNWGSIEWALADLPRLVPHVHIEDGFGPEERNAQIRRRVLMRRLALHWSAIALPSETLTRIATEIWHLPPRCIHYIPNGIDLGRFSGERDVSAAMQWPGAGPVVGTVAALRAEKNLARLLRAFASVRRVMEARLVIVGDGSERTALEQLAAELGIENCTSFVGHIAEPAALFAGFDLFALSSDTEQMPISIIEAMAAGLPIAGTDVGDVRAMVGAENAVTLGPREDASLATNILTLLQDPVLRARLGAANRAKALRDFDQERMFAAYAALFDGSECP